MRSPFTENRSFLSRICIPSVSSHTTVVVVAIDVVVAVFPVDPEVVFSVLPATTRATRERESECVLVDRVDEDSLVVAGDAVVDATL
jgi:hypothetical protein